MILLLAKSGATRLCYLTALLNCVLHEVFQILRILQDLKYQLGVLQRDGRKFCARLSGLQVCDVL